MKKPEPKSNKNAGTRSQVKKDTPKSAESIAEITILTETLRKSELKYRSLYESTLEGIGMTDMEGHILECNRAFQDMLGYTKKEIKNLTYQQITPAKWHAMERDIITNKILKTGYSDTYEKEYIRKDGTVFPVSIRIWAVKDESGNIVGMWAIVTDITARKMAREALRESQHRLEVIVDSIADGFYALDREWHFTHVNDAALQHMGKTSKEILGRTLFDVYPEARGGVIENEYRTAMESGKPRHFENHSLITDRILEIHAYPGRDVLTILFRDVTKQKRMTTALRESEATLRGILDASKESIWLFSPDGVMLMGNETALTRFGKSADDVIGKHFNEILTPELAKSRLAHLREVVESGQPVEFEDERDGIAFLHSFYPVTDAGGRVSSIACFSRDITERKKIEEILRKHLSDLEAANKELESFSYSVSHDLRAPLRAIDGYARSILKKQGDKFDEDTLRKFNDIRSNARTMGKLIDDLLAFSRLSRKDMSTSELNMVDLIREEWKKLNDINPDRKMNLIVQSTPLGYGDAALVKQVYHNLLSNAVKFTKLQDYAHIEVGGYNDGNEDVFYVKDNGVGFDMKYYDKLFGVFQRLHNNPDFEGTGVGLATVQRIVHRQGGRVWAEGKENEGATFYFTLPHNKIE